MWKEKEQADLVYLFPQLWEEGKSLLNLQRNFHENKLTKAAVEKNSFLFWLLFFSISPIRVTYFSSFPKGKKGLLVILIIPDTFLHLSPCDLLLYDHWKACLSIKLTNYFSLSLKKICILIFSTLFLPIHYNLFLTFLHTLTYLIVAHKKACALILHLFTSPPL